MHSIEETQKDNIKWKKQDQKPTYYMILCMWHSKTGKTARSREKGRDDCRGEGETSWNDNNDGYMTIYTDITP